MDVVDSVAAADFSATSLCGGVATAAATPLDETACDCGAGCDDVAAAGAESTAGEPDGAAAATEAVALVAAR